MFLCSISFVKLLILFKKKLTSSEGINYLHRHRNQYQYLNFAVFSVTKLTFCLPVQHLDVSACEDTDSIL